MRGPVRRLTDHMRTGVSALHLGPPVDHHLWVVDVLLLEIGQIRTPADLILAARMRKGVVLHRLVEPKHNSIRGSTRGANGIVPLRSNHYGPWRVFSPSQLPSKKRGSAEPQRDGRGHPHSRGLQGNHVDDPWFRHVKAFTPGGVSPVWTLPQHDRADNVAVKVYLWPLGDRSPILPAAAPRTNRTRPMSTLGTNHVPLAAAPQIIPSFLLEPMLGGCRSVGERVFHNAPVHPLETCSLQFLTHRTSWIQATTTDPDGQDRRQSFGAAAPPS